MVGVAAAVVIAAAGSTLIYWNLPGTRVGRKLDRAAKLAEQLDYDQAEATYMEALAIDEENVQAYWGLADGYMAQGRMEDAEAILKQGYEMTGEEVLQQNYHATVLNGVVEALNSGSADFSAINRCLDVLEERPEQEDALELLKTCGDRVLTEEDSGKVMLDSMDGSETFSEYAAVMERLFALNDRNPAVYEPVLAQYAVIQAQEVYMSLSHAAAYRSILERARQAGVMEADELLACLDKQEQISAYFAPMFTEFEAGNFKAAKSFITTQEYEAIRDAFINNTMDYWYGNSYIPVTKEAIVFLKTDGGWKFSYVENDSLAMPTGAIRVLGQKMKDLGVQRSSIEYVPAYVPGQYYPHTEYEIVYWNTMVSGIATDNTNVVSRMNYRFAEKIYTAEGMEANMIYDWGGANERRQKE